MHKLLILLIFTANIAVAEQISKNQDVITNVLSTFYLYATYEDLWEAFPDDYGTLEGISFCERNVEKNMAWCDIHIVEPQVIDGEHTLTLGHEVEHGIYGEEYHE